MDNNIQAIDHSAHDIVRIVHEIKVESVRHGQRLKELNIELAEVKSKIQSDLGNMTDQ